MKGLKTYLDKGGYLRLDKLLNLYIHSHCMTRSSFQQRFFLLPNDDIAYRFTVWKIWKLEVEIRITIYIEIILKMHVSTYCR